MSQIWRKITRCFPKKNVMNKNATIFLCVCVYKIIPTHTRTHTHKYIYVCIYVFILVNFYTYKLLAHYPLKVQANHVDYNTYDEQQNEDAYDLLVLLTV